MTLPIQMLRALVVAIPVLVLAVGGNASAQQQPSGANPTASSVTEEQLLRELNKLQGRITLPDPQAATLEQPQGRDYRGFHEGALPWIGGILILGVIVVLAVFYFTRGRIRMRADERSAQKILRFGAFERFTHWMTATCFIVLAITGLNYFFGKRLLMPLLGPDAFAAWSQWAKYAHNYLSWPFLVGVLLMAIMWMTDNLPERQDWRWIRAGGGFVGTRRPEAGRFNAGQKLIFWSVVVFGIALGVTGIIMLFPFAISDINGMQLAQYVHAVGGVILIAVIIAHIYIGSLGMQGAFDAMWTGEVDAAWARHHHRLWAEEQQRTKPIGDPNVTAGSPAE